MKRRCATEGSAGSPGWSSPIDSSGLPDSENIQVCGATAMQSTQTVVVNLVPAMPQLGLGRWSLKKTLLRYP